MTGRSKRVWFAEGRADGGVYVKHGRQAIVINEKDNVATALRALASGTKVSLEVQGRRVKITILSDIPMGHKFALRDIPEGEGVIKYGESIGQCTEKIIRGKHVHVHNVVSQSLRKSDIIQK